MRPGPDNNLRTKETTLDLSQAPNTYDAFTAIGDILVTGASFYVSVVGAGGLTSVSVQTNQTNPTIILTAVEGAVALLLAQKNLAFAYSRFPFQLRSGQKIQYTIVGVGTGEVKAVVTYRPISGGSSL